MPDREVLDDLSLDRLRQLDPSGQGRLLHRVLSTYVLSLARLRQQITNGQSEHDTAGLKMGAHTLKSSSASVGALVLSQLCAAVESAIRDGHTERLPQLVDQLQCEIDRVDAAVRRLIAT